MEYAAGAEKPTDVAEPDSVRCTEYTALAPIVVETVRHDQASGANQLRGRTLLIKPLRVLVRDPRQQDGDVSRRVRPHDGIQQFANPLPASQTAVNQ